MTGYTVHTGSSEDFASGWDRIFGDDKQKAKAPKTNAPKAQAKAAQAKKPKTKQTKKK